MYSEWRHSTLPNPSRVQAWSGNGMCRAKRTSTVLGMGMLAITMLAILESRHRPDDELYRHAEVQSRSERMEIRKKTQEWCLHRRLPNTNRTTPLLIT